MPITTKLFSSSAQAGAAPATLEPKLPWEEDDQPATKERFLSLLLELYWNGVHREIRHILLSLVELQENGQSNIERDEGNDGDICGYDTFMDQICVSSRQLAEEYGRSWRLV